MNAAHNEIPRDRSNPHEKHAHSSKINKLHFFTCLNPVAITAKQ